MAKYRQYVNGIYGLRENGWYIEVTRGEGKKKTFQLIDPLGCRYPDIYDDEGDAIWQVFLKTSSSSEKELIAQLYQYNVRELNDLLSKYYERGDDKDKDKRALGTWIERVRDRKIKDKPMGFDLAWTAAGDQQI